MHKWHQVGSRTQRDECLLCDYLLKADQSNFRQIDMSDYICQGRCNRHTGLLQTMIILMSPKNISTEDLAECR